MRSSTHSAAETAATITLHSVVDGNAPQGDRRDAAAPSAGESMLRSRRNRRRDAAESLTASLPRARAAWRNRTATIEGHRRRLMAEQWLAAA